MTTPETPSSLGAFWEIASFILLVLSLVLIAMSPAIAVMAWDNWQDRRQTKKGCSNQ